MTKLAVVGLIGKHPGYGDFLHAGLSPALAEALSQWLDSSLAGLRDQLGNDWAGFWDGAQDLRFWIGRAVLGRTLAGVLRPSRDKVGRRYPLLLLAEGAALGSPLESPDQAPWQALADHLDAMRPGQGAAALLQGLMADFLAEPGDSADIAPQPQAQVIWAHRVDGDLAGLLAAAGPADRDRAALGRSYWWAPAGPGRAACWLGVPGLPDAAALGWALAGVAGAPRPPQPAATTPAPTTPAETAPAPTTSVEAPAPLAPLPRPR